MLATFNVLRTCVLSVIKGGVFADWNAEGSLLCGNRIEMPYSKAKRY